MKNKTIAVMLTIMLAAYNQLEAASECNECDISAINVVCSDGKVVAKDMSSFFAAYGEAIPSGCTREEIIERICNSSGSLFRSHFLLRDSFRGQQPSKIFLENHEIYFAAKNERYLTAKMKMAARVEAWHSLPLIEYLVKRRSEGNDAILIVGCGHIVPFSNDSCSESHLHEGCYCVNIAGYRDDPCPRYKASCADKELDITTTSLEASFERQFDVVVLERPGDRTLSCPQALKNASQILKIGGKLYIDFHESYTTHISYKDLVTENPEDHLHNSALLCSETKWKFSDNYALALYLSKLGFTEVESHSEMRSPFARGIEGAHTDRIGFFITAVWTDATAGKDVSSI